MNKTLLLILVDFLLLTILAIADWDQKEEKPPPVQAEPADATGGESVAAMEMMEQDLLDTLQYSLEEQREAQEELAEALTEREQEIQARESRIQNLQSTLEQAQTREEQLQQEREALAATTQDLRSEAEQLAQRVQESTQALQTTEETARQAQAQSRLLQEELQRKLAEVEAKEAALAQASQQLQQSQERIQELGTQVQLGEQERTFLRESVTELKSEVASERQERQRVQEQAGALAEGVTKLAESSQDLRQEIRSNTPINANQLFSLYQNNQVEARFRALKLQRNRYVETEEQASTVLVSDNGRIYALMHVESGPFAIKSNPALVGGMRLELAREGDRVSAGEMQFLKTDPRVVAIPLSEEQADRLGGTPYLTALEPFKFAQAVLVNKEGDYYGEVEFKLDASTPGYVKMDSKIFSALFGEFAPSTGDLVLSKTGELLGVMVNRRYCAIVQNLESLQSLPLGASFERDTFRKVLNALDDRLDDYPSEIR